MFFILYFLLKGGPKPKLHLNSSRTIANPMTTFNRRSTTSWDNIQQMEPNWQRVSNHTQKAKSTLINEGFFALGSKKDMYTFDHDRCPICQEETKQKPAGNHYPPELHSLFVVYSTLYIGSCCNLVIFIRKNSHSLRE